MPVSGSRNALARNSSYVGSVSVDSEPPPQQNIENATTVSDKRETKDCTVPPGAPCCFIRRATRLIACALLLRAVRPRAVRKVLVLVLALLLLAACGGRLVDDEV